MPMSREPCANGGPACEDTLLLDRLVAAEIEAVGHESELTIEDEVARLADRLCGHPNRLALLDRLRDKVLGQAEAPPAAAEPPSAEGDP
jgi:hypothetical protein